MIDWAGGGYTSDWRMYAVDMDTLADAAAVPDIDAVTVERVRGGLIESASIEATFEPGSRFEEGYYRIVMQAEQNGNVERVEIGTFHCSSASGGYDRGAKSIAIDGRSVLYPASTRRLLAGTYAPKGADGAVFAASLLSECIAFPVEVEGSFKLGDHIVFSVGESYLDAVWDVLGAGGFCIQIDGDGTTNIVPMPTDAALTVDSGSARLMVPSVSYALDYSAVPNRVKVMKDGAEAVAVNDDPASEVSVAARGYYHDLVETAPTLLEGETLASYATRRLKEKSVVEDSRTYEREWWPGVAPYSLVRGDLDEIGMDGDYRVTRQEVRCGAGVVVTEEVCREVSLWPVE